MAIDAFDLSYVSYGGDARARYRVPPRVAIPFINTNRRHYRQLRKSVHDGDLYLPPRLHWRRFCSRVDPDTYRKVRHAYDRSYSYSSRYFPAYRPFWAELLSAEWLSAVEWRKYHRDHMVHQVLTSYVGLSLLQGGPNDRFKTPAIGGAAAKTLLEHAVEAVLRHRECEYLRQYARDMGVAPDLLEPSARARRVWRNVILDTFFVAAMFHDIGYPWQFVNRIHEGLEVHDPLDNPAAQGADWIAERYEDRLVFYPLSGYQRTDPSRPGAWRDEYRELVARGLTKTHGMPSAIAFLHLNDTLRSFPVRSAPPLRRFCVEWAAMAIMMHDMVNVYGKAVRLRTGGYRLGVEAAQLQLRFERDPLSCILTLSDVIQDFERYDTTFSRGVASYGSRCRAIGLTWNDGTHELTVTFRYPNHYQRSEKRRFIQKEEVVYFRPGRGFVDLRHVGIQRVRLGVSP